MNSQALPPFICFLRLNGVWLEVRLPGYVQPDLKGSSVRHYSVSRYKFWGPFCQLEQILLSLCDLAGSAAFVPKNLHLSPPPLSTNLLENREFL